MQMVLGKGISLALWKGTLPDASEERNFMATLNLLFVRT